MTWPSTEYVARIWRPRTGLSVAVARSRTTAVGYGFSAVTSRSIRHGSGTGIDSFEAIGQQLDRQGVRPMAPGRSDDRRAAPTSMSGSAASPTSRSNGVNGHDGVRCVEMGVATGAGVDSAPRRPPRWLGGGSGGWWLRGAHLR